MAGRLIQNGSTPVQALSEGRRVVEGGRWRKQKKVDRKRAVPECLEQNQEGLVVDEL